MIFRWYIYETEEEIDFLIASLNTRGYRESHLRINIINHKPVAVHNLNKSKVGSIVSRKTLNINGNNVLEASSYELAFRDQLLEFEERIWFGTLGILNVSNKTIYN